MGKSPEQEEEQESAFNRDDEQANPWNVSVLGDSRALICFVHACAYLANVTVTSNEGLWVHDCNLWCMPPNTLYILWGLGGGLSMRITIGTYMGIPIPIAMFVLLVFFELEGCAIESQTWSTLH